MKSKNRYPKFLILFSILVLIAFLGFWGCEEREWKPFVTTSSVTEETSSTAIAGGKVEAEDGTTVTERGVCWSTSKEPTLTDNKAKVGKGTGSFSYTISGLNAETNYYVRAYAFSGGGTAYGDIVSFTTQLNITVPIVNTSAGSNVTSESATLNGNVTSDGNATVTARGFYWSSSNSIPDSGDYKTTSGNGTGSFSSSITGLTANTPYYFVAYATNSEGTATGEVKQFNTSVNKITPTVETNSATNFTSESAILNGNVTSDGNSTVTARGFYWSLSNSTPDSGDNKITSGNGTGSFSSSITGLTDNTPYYFCAFATNSEGTGTGTVRTFTTDLSLFPLINEVVDTDVHDGDGGGVGNSDYYIEVGEEIDLAVEIQNNGTGTAYNIIGKLSFYDSSDGSYCTITDSEEPITSLSAGQADELDDFDFDVTGMPTDKELNFKLTITYEDEYGNTYSNIVTGGDLDLNVYYFKTINIIEDAYISSGSPDDNTGSENVLTIAENIPSLLKSGSLGIPSGSEIRLAKLLLYSASIVADPFKIQSSRVTSSWSESSVTYNNRPTWSTTSRTLTWADPAVYTWFSVNISDIVQEWVNGTSNYGIIIRNYSGYDGSVFNSTESSNYHPVIEIRYR